MSKSTTVYINTTLQTAGRFTPYAATLKLCPMCHVAFFTAGWNRKQSHCSDCLNKLIQLADCKTTLQRLNKRNMVLLAQLERLR